MTVTDDLGAGTILAGFRVESLLGHGGMSTVYRAADLRLKRRVALKVMAADLAADQDFRERFLRESELAASIDHPHIVPIYEAGESGGVLFIAMRYVEGGDLKARLRCRRMELGEATALLAQVAGALDAAHARGLVHRDVKPSNILLDPGTGPDGSDHAYLADFGVTTRLADGPVSDGRALVGTIDYVAPEQIAGGPVDGRADLYSLGCVLYECLVGEPPFRRDTDVEVVFAHLDADPPAVSERRSELPVALDAVIARALAKEPTERYPTCRELTGAILSVAVDETGRHLADLASRAAAGRHDLSDVETELAGKVIELQAARERVRALSGGPAPTRGAEGRCPYKGLASFEPADAENFFGRERLVAELVARLASATFLGIVGPSGSGKSSVLHAGLVPALAGGVLPGSEHWRLVLARPGDRPWEELQRTLEPAADETVLLVVDQLEELFIAYDSDQERAAFADAIAWSPAVVVVALRADFYGRFAAYPALAERLGTNHVLVGPMRESELRLAVEGPAGRVDLRVEPALADRLIDEVEGAPGALPLLSTALVELWQHRHGDTLSLTSYQESGGVHGAIARLAEGTYSDVPDEQRPLVRAIMLRLVGDGDVDTVVRRPAPLAELDLGREEVAGVLATLADGRLVTVSQDNVELAHEALLREWPRLRGWIEEDAAGRRLRRQITDAAWEWDTAGHDPSGLYRGARLAAAVDWTADHAGELNTLEREFIESSRDADEQQARRARRTNRRLRGMLAAVAVLLAVALVGGTLAVVAADRARDAETARLAQLLGAQALLEEDLDLSLLLARQSLAISDTPQTRSTLLTVLAKAPTAIAIMHVSDDAFPMDVAPSPDGSTLAVPAADKIHFFDTRTHQRIAGPLTTSTMPVSVAYSPNGRLLAYAREGLDGTGFLHVIDARTRAELVTAPIEGAPRTVAFTDDGTRLVVIASGSTPVISIRDSATLDEVAPSIEPADFRVCDDIIQCAGQFALTPGGRSIVLVSDAGMVAWWDLATGQRIRTPAIDLGERPFAISRDGLAAAVGTEQGIRLIDLATGASRTASDGLTGPPFWLRFSPDAATVVSANADGAVTLWDTESATVRETLYGHRGLALKSAFSTDGGTLYTIGRDLTAIAWDLAGTRSVRRTFPIPYIAGPPPSAPSYPPFNPGRFSPDGTLIAIGLNGKGIALMDATDLTPVGAALVETGGEVKALAFSPDGHTLAAAATSGAVTMWDVASGSLRHKPIYTRRTIPGLVPGLAFTPDGSVLLTTSGSGVQSWDVAAGTGLGRLTAVANETSDLSLSADGTLAAFALGSRGGVEVWDVARRSPVAQVPGNPDADQSSVALSPDGRTLAVGGSSSLVRLWDVGTGERLHELDQGGTRPMSLEFSPDGRLLASGSTLWDVATGTRIGPNLAGESETMTDLSADGRRLLVTTEDGRGEVWDVDPESWAQRTCSLANRALTQAEWERFIPGRPYEPACAR